LSGWNTLRRWEGALIIVSHDRYFLDRVVNRVWELSRRRFRRLIAGNYSSYVRQRARGLERSASGFTQRKGAAGGRDRLHPASHIAGGQTDIAKGAQAADPRPGAASTRPKAAVADADLQAKSWLEIGARVRTLSVNEAVERIRALIRHAQERRRAQDETGAAEAQHAHRAAGQDRRRGLPGRPLFEAEDTQAGARWPAPRCIGAKRQRQEHLLAHR
jgi:ATPase subunit of ABC transporter with duplicated ATPase domains